MERDLAPIAVFAWQRAKHTCRVLEALAANEGAESSDLIIFIDGPRGRQDQQSIAEVAAVAERAHGFRSVEVRRSGTNLGLSRAITGGVSSILERSERVIVVEDDILVSSRFLTYMNDHLDLYANEPRVSSIHAYVYPHFLQLPSTFFIRGADCWGWATWRRAWNTYSSDGAALLRELERRDLTYEFDFGGRAGYTKMLRDQIAGRNDSWAVRWYASTFLAEMLTLYPAASLAANIGTDGSGVHGGLSRTFDVPVSDVHVVATPIPIAESAVGRAAFESFFRSKADPSHRPLLYRLARSSVRPIWHAMSPRVRQRALGILPTSVRSRLG